MISYDELKEKSFSSRIAFLNLNARGRYALFRTQPPLGLMSLMGICRDFSIPYGYIDADAYDLDDTKIIAAIIDGQYTCIGVSLLSLKAARVFPLLERIKRETKIKIIVGGPLPTADTEWLLQQCPAIDYAVVGEGEIILPQVLLALERKIYPQEIPGLAFRDGGKVFFTPRSDVFLSGDKVPMPDFQAIDFRYYSGTSPVGAWPSANLLVTRGCPFQCTFCSNPIWNHKPNFVSVPTVIRWLEHLRRLGIREVFFVDDTLNLNSSWFENLCGQLIKTGLNQKMIFKGPFRANLTNPRQLKLAREAGFWLIFYGVESGNQDVLNYYRKGEKVKEMAEAIHWTRAAGLKSQASLIAGAPIDTVNTLLETSNFLRVSVPDYAPTHPLIPYMGTKIAEDVISQGILTAEEIRTYDHTAPTIRTKTLDTQELLSIIECMRRDFVHFKTSPFFALKRRQELKVQGYDSRDILILLGREQKEAEELIPDGVPLNLSLVQDDPRLKDLTDELICFTSDFRFAEGKWYDCENGIFRWSRSVFSCPFFLKDPRGILEIHWASMRPESVEVKITINGEMPIRLNIQEPEWHTDKIPLGQKIQGVVWVKFEVSKAFLPSGDTRKLGMAFQSIRFVAN